MVAPVRLGPHCNGGLHAAQELCACCNRGMQLKIARRLILVG